jgi:hypothetical protein
MNILQENQTLSRCQAASPVGGSIPPASTIFLLRFRPRRASSWGPASSLDQKGDCHCGSVPSPRHHHPALSRRLGATGCDNWTSATDMLT